jgi:hypothetical protein
MMTRAIINNSDVLLVINNTMVFVNDTYLIASDEEINIHSEIGSAVIRGDEFNTYGKLKITEYCKSAIVIKND